MTEREQLSAGGAVDKLREQIQQAEETYRATKHIVGVRELEARQHAIKALKVAHSAAIAEGADPCPDCDSPATGGERDLGATILFDVGCPACGVFRFDGKLTEHRVRDFESREEAVEAWNAGPSAWRRTE